MCYGIKKRFATACDAEQEGAQMIKQDIIEFCAQHCACEEFCGWALDTCDSMYDVWLSASPKWLVWVATRQGVLSDKELRLFACYCVRQVWHLLDDDRSKNAVTTAEKYANGEATGKELSLAHSYAACAAVIVYAHKGVGAMWSATLAAKAVATLQATNAARAAASYVAEAASDVVISQAEYLRERFSPFTVEGEK